jgi:hypothetical protein
MPYEHRELSGSLFTNDDKTPGDTRPDFRGKALIGGVEYRVSAWKQTSRGVVG